MRVPRTNCPSGISSFYTKGTFGACTSGVRRVLLLAATLLASGCGSIYVQDSGPNHSMDLSRVPDPIPKVEPRSKYGNPESYVVMGKRYKVMSNSDGYVQQGIASWYGKKFHGRRTSSGEIYNMYGMTAAHKRLPLPAYVRVTNLDNKRSIIVRVNDRGPFHEGRIIDLSYAAASKLGVVETGTAPVEIRVINPGRPGPATTMAAKDIATNTAVVATAAKLSGTEVTATPLKLYLQLGAFISRNNAERLHQQLAQTQIPQIHIHESQRADNNTVYRVRIGPLPNAKAADQLAQRVAQLGLGTPQIVND